MVGEGLIIFWDDMPFAARAQFMRDNVMGLSEDFVAAYEPERNPGFSAFQALLLELYGAPEAFSGEDDLARFHALSYATQIFFSAMAQAGILTEDGQSLEIDKADFKKAYKKPSNAPFEILPHFGVDFAYRKKGKPVASYAQCDAFTLSFPQRMGIAGALKRMAKRFGEVDHKREYAEALVMLCKADYDRLVLGRPAIREEIDPLRPDIVRATGEGSVLYEEIARRAAALGLGSSVSIQRYANPTWNVNFLRGKKLRLKTIWCEGRNYMHVPVPFAKAEDVIRSRDGMAPQVRAAIERFGCVNCGRCKSGGNVKFLKVDGITVCSGHGESSTLFISVTSSEEIASIFEVIASLE